MEMHPIRPNGPIPGLLIILYWMTFEHLKYICLWLKQLVECPLCSLCLQMLTYCPVDGTLRHYASPSLSDCDRRWNIAVCVVTSWKRDSLLEWRKFELEKLNEYKLLVKQTIAVKSCIHIRPTLFNNSVNFVFLNVKFHQTVREP